MNKGASTIDYALASDSLSDDIKGFNVMPQTEYSDHCKIIVRVKNILAETAKDEISTYKWHPVPPPFKWEANSHECFKTSLMSPEIQVLSAECSQYIEAGLIDSSGNKIQEIFVKTAELCLKTPNTKKIKTQNVRTKKKNNPKMVRCGLSNEKV